MSPEARTYGDALYELSRDEGLSEQILSDLQGTLSVFKETPEYRKLLSEPSLPRAERCALISEAFRGQVHLYTLNFLRILTERSLIGAFRDCVLRFRERYNEDNGIAEASVVSAVPLTENQKARLLAKLTEITGKRISLREETDPALLGGIRLTMENREFDGTVRGRIDALSTALRETTV